MALGYLVILYIALIIVGVALQYFLYRKENMIFYILNTVFGLLLAYLVFTSLPTNYRGQKIISLIFALVGVLGMAVKLGNRESKMVARLMLSLSIVGGMIQLFI